jgi:hypothetical protein
VVRSRFVWGECVGTAVRHGAPTIDGAQLEEGWHEFPDSERGGTAGSR